MPSSSANLGLVTLTDLDIGPEYTYLRKPTAEQLDVLSSQWWVQNYGEETRDCSMLWVNIRNKETKEITSLKGVSSIKASTDKPNHYAIKTIGKWYHFDKSKYTIRMRWDD